MSDQVHCGSSNSTMEQSDQKTIFPGYNSLTDFTKDGYKLLMESIKQANCLPAGRDWNFYTTFDSVKSVLNTEANHIIDNINLILTRNDVGGTMRNMTLESKTERLIDANDILLERVANNIDELNGIRKVNTEPVKLQTVSAELVKVNGSWNRSNAKFSVSSSLVTSKEPLHNSETRIRLLTAENIVRPQKLFKDKIDNTNENPWQPKIKEKPNSLKPLSILLEEVEGGVEFSHPYLYELERFNPPEDQLTSISITNPKPVNETPLIEITKQEQLHDLVEDLRKENVIAVDLEHHSYRSFMGITCLMQISTKDKDYLIDALTLRSELWILNEIFTRPEIVKIFHGAQSDVLWLQRDLSLYVVNMFDTYFAAKQLGYSKLSLAYLMQKFCNFLPNKQFQLADWRIRPLPQELKDYAREDTHYLIFIYQKMRNELISKANGADNLLKAAIQNSTDLCKIRYSKPKWHEDSHLELYRRCNRMFDNRQMFALKELYKWRDYISREQDESTGYVLPNNMLLEIAQRLPREMQGIIACCNPVPPLVQANLLDLHKIILKALEKPFEQPILKEDTRARGTTKKMSKINIDSPLHCPHDLTNVEEFRDDLPTLLGNSKASLNPSFDTLIEQPRSICSVFNPIHITDDDNLNLAEKFKRFREGFKFLSPFDRYQLVKPFIKAKEKKLAEDKLKNKEDLPKPTETADVIDLKNDVSVEESIESVHQHFLLLSRSGKPEPAVNKEKLSLIEMGGSRKRKREEYNSTEKNPKSSLDTPIPNIEVPIVVGSSKRNETEVKTSGKRKWQPSPAESSGKRPKPANNKDKFKKNKKGNNGSQGTHSHNKTWTRNSDNNKNVNTNRGGGSQEPNAYDYSMVDFRQFRGGAGKVQLIRPISLKYKAKGKSNRGMKSSIIGRKGGF
ncbi:exosome component Rrp6 [Rhynchophorus ferrugineus]|uniref:Exosome complex component 10 homolog n=1 Tax=Rhynchophorus ferrugineus TaxID=354439 RepID=A0A834IPU0_RHYFE|nr:hypothetical protein GWI33_022431 [Rhynchophorus ferrugineus]